MMMRSSCCVLSWYVLYFNLNIYGPCYMWGLIGGRHLCEDCSVVHLPVISPPLSSTLFTCRSFDSQHRRLY